MPPTLEAWIRLGLFGGVLLAMAIWEVCAPRRAPRLSRASRWTGNLGLAALNTLAARWLLPVSAVAAATFAAERGWGLLHLVDWPWWVEAGCTIVALDLIIYLQHVLFHAVPTLWRLHRVHHVDLELDVTTGVRFHTLEILLSALLKLAAVVVLGPTPEAVIAFEVLLNATSMFNHSNVRLPAPVDGILRWVLVTPDMHRVHHSVVREEQGSNFGFNLPWWDYWLGTYRAKPAAPLVEMEIGVADCREPRQATPLWRLLLMPWLRT